MKKANSLIFKIQSKLTSKISKLEIANNTILIYNTGTLIRAFPIEDVKKIFIRRERNRKSIFGLIGIIFLIALLLLNIVSFTIPVLVSALIIVAFLINEVNTQVFSLFVCINSGEIHSYPISNNLKYRIIDSVKQIRAILRITNFNKSHNELLQE